MGIEAWIFRLDSDAVYHFGKIPERRHEPDTNSLIVSFESEGEFVVGDFTHRDGTRYAMIVNKDLSKSTNCRLQFRETPRQVMVILPYSGEPHPFGGEDAWLAPGQGALLKIER